MSKFVPEKEHLQHVLLFLFNQKKKAVESHRVLVETYGEHAPSIRTCETWFRQFKSGDFNVKDSERSGRPQKCENEQLEVLLEDDPTQTQQQLAKALNVSQETISRRLRVMGKINKLGKWVPHDLSERQMENRKVTCEMLLQRHERRSFLYLIVTGDEKWIENPKRKKSCLSPGQTGPLTPRLNRFGKKTMLCVWWDQSGIVYYELLKPGETVNAQRYRQQMINLNHALIERRPEWARRHGKVIVLHDNAPSHTAKPVKDTLK